MLTTKSYGIKGFYHIIKSNISLAVYWTNTKPNQLLSALRVPTSGFTSLNISSIDMILKISSPYFHHHIHKRACHLTVPGIILCMRPAYELWHYIVISHWLGAYKKLSLCPLMKLQRVCTQLYSQSLQLIGKKNEVNHATNNPNWMA